MKSNFFSSSSILRKFLVFNLIIFLVLGIFTYLYLEAIKPSLVKDRSNQHLIIVNNTTDHINRLNIEFNKDSITAFLLSTRFLFQNLDRVQLYDLNFNLLADTNTLDLAEDIFVVNQNIEETAIDKSEETQSTSEPQKILQTKNFDTKNYVKKYSKQKNITDEKINLEKLQKKLIKLVNHKIRIWSFQD